MAASPALLLALNRVAVKQTDQERAPKHCGLRGDLLVIWQICLEFRAKTALNPRRRYSGCESSRPVLESRPSIDFFHQPHFV